MVQPVGDDPVAQQTNLFMTHLVLGGRRLSHLRIDCDPTCISEMELPLGYGLTCLSDGGG